MPTDIEKYNKALGKVEREIAAELCARIAKTLPKADGKVWHGHPVWFIDGNPVVGYSLKKSGIEVLFWSGQSFDSPALRPVGKFKAAGMSVPSLEQLDTKELTACLKSAKTIQWDYENLPKKRKLEKLTDF
jgi:hypothetical protein